MSIAYNQKKYVMGNMYDMSIVGTNWTEDESLVPTDTATGTDVYGNTVPLAYPGSTYKGKDGSTKTLYPDGTWA